MTPSEWWQSIKDWQLREEVTAKAARQKMLVTKGFVRLWALQERAEKAEATARVLRKVLKIRES